VSIVDQTLELRRFAFRVEYDGRGYHGWQRQQNAAPTIQGVLEEQISQLLGQQVELKGASRTDAGVHARDQLAAVSLRHPIPTFGFVKAINRRLPGSIAIRDAQEVPLDFEPRFANQGKVYCYRLYHSLIRRPLLDQRAWRLPWSLDLLKLSEAAGLLIGHRDFCSFAATRNSHISTIRNLYRIELSVEKPLLSLRFSGNAFLKYMIRNLVGTLVEIGRGRLEPQRISEILEARDRRAAGPKAPAHGLELERIILKTQRQSPS